MKKLHFLTATFCLFIITAFAQAQQKIEPSLLADLKKQPEVSCLVVFTSQADLAFANTLPTKEAKGNYAYTRLTQIADRSQADLRALLTAENIDFQSFWAVNALHIEAANESLLQRLAARTEIAQIIADAPMTAHQPSISNTNIVAEQRVVLANTTWGIAKIQADLVWDLGYTGTNIVVGGQDTGYKWDLDPIKAKYRGWNGTTADHNYNWHDAIHERDTRYSDENPFGYDLIVPIDDQQHGTHTMGTMVGETDDNGVNIGVAPTAKWIGCRNMERGWGKPSTYIECFQWFIAPTNLQNGAPDPTKAPHVINNSWGCPTDEGCTTANFDVMSTVVANVKAAGIFVTVSAGNSGSNCGSVDSPAAIFEPSFSVGATNSMDTIAGFSSRGPVTVDGSNRRKPNVSAPGVDVRSCTPDGSFQNWNGTSMAGPHVAGAVALILSARPDLAGQVDVLENILEQTADKRYTNDQCGGDLSTDSPNNTYGFGRINVLRAVQAALTVATNTRAENGQLLIANAIPNPANEATTIQVKGLNGRAMFRIFNATGQVLLSHEYTAQAELTTFPIALAAFANGLYFYTVQAEKQSVSGKIVVQH